MSNLGLNSNIYFMTGKYLDLINSFILNIKSQPDSINNTAKLELVNFLKKLSSSESVDPQIQILYTMIERDLRMMKKKARLYIGDLINDLESNSLDKASNKLEELANTLDKEHFEALAKIKGE